MRVKAENGQIREVHLLEVTPENFIVPKGEEHLYHCRIEVRKFNQETGVRVSTPRLQVFGRKFFENYGLHNLRKQGFTVDILHDPSEWLRNHEHELKEAEKARIEARRIEEIEAEKAAEAAKAAEKEAMKKEIIEELKAAGVIPAAKETKATKAAEAAKAAEATK